MRAYLVNVPDFVIIVRDPRDLKDEVAAAVGDSYQARWLTPDELEEWGPSYPIGSYDPDRELTCAEIAAEMRRGR
jgi:hypothetical protein